MKVSECLWQAAEYYEPDTPLWQALRATDADYPTRLAALLMLYPKSEQVTSNNLGKGAEVNELRMNYLCMLACFAETDIE